MENEEQQQNNALHLLISKPLIWHLQQLFACVLLYLPVLVLMLYAPIKLGQLLFPSLCPLHLQFQRPFAEVQLPMDLLLFHVAVPYALEKMRLRPVLRPIIHGWFHLAAGVLGLREFLLTGIVYSV
jgi:hypothetical protein